MGVARKWQFSTSGGAANLGGVSGDLSEDRGSGISLLGITSLFMHKLTGLHNTFPESVIIKAFLGFTNYIWGLRAFVLGC